MRLRTDERPRPMPKLNRPQAAFLQLKRKFRALVAGFGSGKTWAGCEGMMSHYIERPGINQGYFAPTFPHIRDIFYPTIEEVAHGHGFRVKINESNKEVHFFKGAWSYGTTICRSMSLPHTIVGFKIGNALIDEIDVMATDKARTAWRKIIARMRYNVDGLRNGIDVTTTPEGFKFTHEQFVEQVRKKPAVAAMYGLVHASTYENEKNLPADYIPSLIASYPGPLISAYIEGQFVNLTSGSVYPAFNRITNFTNATANADEYLHIGMDFNVGKMAAVIHVIRNGRPLAVNELVDLLDTPAMIVAIKLKYPGRNISVYPDASGNNRKSQNASETDISLLKAAGFQVLNDPANPAVRDRILCMNIAFRDGYGVNPDTCPRYVEGLEKQAYKDDGSGEPDKSSGFDHANDAGGYFIFYRFPLVHNRVQRITLGGT